MPKTRQQRLAEERAGQPQSPPQCLEDKPRVSKRTRAKTPSGTGVAGPVVPATGVAGPVVSATQSAPSGEPQALLRIWVGVGPGDSSQPVDDFTHQETIPSSRVPELVTFLENICNQEKDNEMVEAISPKNQTVKKPPRAKKRAFRRNPMGATSSIFEPQPMTASFNTSTADGISLTTSLDTSAAEGISSPQAGPPETPQRSKWSIGSLFQADSIKKLLGFSPLAPVSESPESLPQTPTTSTPQILTGEPAPTEPKNKRSSSISAKDARAKHRRHNDSIIKPVKSTTTTSKNQRDRLLRAREASPACRRNESTGVEEEQFPDIRPTDRAQEEARQGEAEGPTPKPTIRWPSRSLDRMNQNKRKRWGEPVAIPSPDRGSYDLGERDLGGNKEKYGVGEEQPSKIRRTSGSQEFTSQVAGDPNTARPYEYQGGNVFAEYEAQKATNGGNQSQPKTPIPITNSTGTFKVPSPGDSDWSESGSEEEEGTQRIPPLTESEALPPSISKPAAKHGSGSQAAVENEPSIAVDLQSTDRTSFTAFEDWCKTAPLAVTAALETMEVDSNIAGDAFARGLGDTGTDRTNRYAAFDEWSKTAPPAVLAVLENMEVDSDLAGQAFQSGLDNYTKN